MSYALGKKKLCTTFGLCRPGNSQKIWNRTHPSFLLYIPVHHHYCAHLTALSIRQDHARAAWWWITTEHRSRFDTTPLYVPADWSDLFRSFFFKEKFLRREKTCLETHFRADAFFYLFIIIHNFFQKNINEESLFQFNHPDASSFQHFTHFWLKLYCVPSTHRERSWMQSLVSIKNGVHKSLPLPREAAASALSLSLLLSKEMDGVIRSWYSATSPSFFNTYQFLLSLFSNSPSLLHE